jgi:multiple sugar transport system permease protein
MIAVAVVPAVIFFVVWVYFPVLYSMYVSLYDWRTNALTQTYIALDNYVRLFREDPLFYTSLRNTFLFTLAAVPLGAALALGVALLINSLPRGQSFFRTIYFLPVVTSTVAVSIIWKWLYQDQFGLINQTLRVILVDVLGLGVSPTIQWLTSKGMALPSLIIVSLWQGLGYNLVLFLAGLTAIPREFYDAAQVDGAGRWSLFRHITLPLLQPTLLFVVITGVINGLQVIVPMFVITQGGPANATRSVVLHLYEKAFFGYQLGYASAVGFILFLIILVFTFVQLRLMRQTWEY